MDGCSWAPSLASCDDSDHLHRHREGQDGVMSSQLQQQLEQIYMLMDMELEDEHELHLHHAGPPPPGSSDVTSTSPVLTSSSTTTFCELASCLDTPLFSPLPYYLDTIPNLEEIIIMSQARHKDDGHADTSTTCSAFRQYVRHLRPKKKLEQGAGGQRAIKTAMSVLAKMHSANKLSQWQSQQSSRTEMPPDETESKLQHVMLERRRREKINHSFDALRNALPPSSKRDKSSILMRARDYINSLKSRVSQLEEKGMALESQLYGNGQDVNGSPEKIQQYSSSLPLPEKIVVSSSCF